MHHAYLYEGGLSLLRILATDAANRFSIEKKKGEELRALFYEKFGVEEARLLKNMAALKTGNKRTVFLLGTSSMTVESQQALLKLFEEPQEGVYFVLLAQKGTLLPTLRSRFLPYPAELEAEASLAGAKKFLALSQKLRSGEIAKLLKDEEGVRERVLAFLSEIERVLHPSAPKKKEIRAALEDIAKVRSYASDRSPSLKMLLEHLAISLPTLR